MRTTYTSKTTNSNNSLGSGVLVRLPSEKQAMHLLSVFEEACNEYHWFLRQRFRDRIRQTYSQPTSHTDDRNWFCQLSLVLALGQALGKEPKQESEETGDPWDFNQSSAPLDLFGQAVSLFSISETITVEDLEVLNLMVS
jgi:proline utilization trans-activator